MSKKNNRKASPKHPIKARKPRIVKTKTPLGTIKTKNITSYLQKRFNYDNHQLELSYEQLITALHAGLEVKGVVVPANFVLHCQTDYDGDVQGAVIEWNSNEQEVAQK